MGLGAHFYTNDAQTFGVVRSSNFESGGPLKWT